MPESREGMATLVLRQDGRGHCVLGNHAFICTGDFLSDGLVHAMLNVLAGDADGVGDGALAGGAMGFHYRAVETKEGRASKTFGIHAAFDGTECVFGEQRAKLAPGICSQLALEHVFNTTLPTNPSHMTTSTRFLNKSCPSTLPMKFRSSSLQSLNASSVNPLPLVSSVPMLRMPTRGFL